MCLKETPAGVFEVWFFLLQSLKQKERKEKELKAKLQSEQALLITRLTELGAGDYVRALTGDVKMEEEESVAPTSPPPILRNSLLEESEMVVDETSKGSVSGELCTHTHTHTHTPHASDTNTHACTSNSCYTHTHTHTQMSLAKRMKTT